MAESYSEHLEKTNVEKRAFLPTVAELVLLTLSSLLFFVLINSVSVYKTIDGQGYNMLSDIFKRYGHQFGTFIDTLIGPTGITFIVWMIIGLAVYVLLWLGAGLLAIYSEEHVVTKGRVLPPNFNAAFVLRESVIRIIIRLLAAVCMLAWLYFAVTTILPILSNIFLQDIVDISLVTLLSVLWTSAAFGLTIFVFFVLARCVVLRDRVWER